MRKSRRIASLFLLAGVLTIGPSAALAQQPKTWDYAGGGQWPLAEAPAAETVANPALDKAQRLLDAKQPDDAEGLLIDWVKSHRTAPDRDRALYLLGETYFRQGDRIKSFYQFDELLDTYPESGFFNPALERQYAIADAFLKGYKRKFLGMHLLSATDEAIDMLFRIRERSPGSPLAERAILRTGDYYYNTGQFDLAGDVYTAYLRSYPRSPDVPRVRLRRAFSSYAQFRGVRFDATPLIEARAQLEDFRTRYPEMAAEENVQRFIDNINEALARKLGHNADFYRRTGHAQAAVYTYRQLIDTYPNSQVARQAEAALKTMPASALAAPAPPSGNAPFDTAAASGTTRPVEPLGPTTAPLVVPERRPAGERLAP